MLTDKSIRCFSFAFALFSIGVLVYLMSCSCQAFGRISDFPEYYAPAKLCLRAHGADTYVIGLVAQEQHKYFTDMGSREVLLFVPPPGLMLIIFLGLLTPLAALITWKVLLVACLIASVVLLARMFSLGEKNVCYLIGVICLSHACYEVLRIDQLAPILLLALTAALYCLQKKQDYKAGLLLSLFILKPQLIVAFLAYLVGVRHWRPVVMFIAVLFVLTVLSYFVIGNTGYKNYLELVRSPISIQYMCPELMPTLRGQLLRVLPTMASNIMLLSIAVYAIVIGVSFLLGAKNRRSDNAIFCGILVIMPLSLITSLHCHSYDLLLLIPSLIMIFCDTVVPFKPYQKLLVVAGGFLFVLPFALDIHYHYLLVGGKCNIWFVALLMLSGLILSKAVLEKPLVCHS